MLLRMIFHASKGDSHASENDFPCPQGRFSHFGVDISRGLGKGMDLLTLEAGAGQKFEMGVNSSVFKGDGGQKSQEGVDFSLFEMNFGQKTELGVDFSNKSTPSWLFWP